MLGISASLPADWNARSVWHTLCELFPFSGRKLQRKENVFHGSVEGKSNSATFSYIRDFFIIFLQLFLRILKLRAHVTELSANDQL